MIVMVILLTMEMTIVTMKPILMIILMLIMIPTLMMIPMLNMMTMTRVLGPVHNNGNG